MIASQEREFKINKVIFKVMIVPRFRWQSFIKIEDNVKSYLCPNFNTKTVPNDDVISG